MDSKPLERGSLLKGMGKYPWCLSSNGFMGLGPFAIEATQSTIDVLQGKKP